MASGQPSGAAQRRRQRRLRSWWRHEQQSIAAALATVMHHSSSKVHTANGHGARSLPPRPRRRWSTSRTTPYGDKALPLGERLAPLSEVAGPQRSDPTVRLSAREAPLLVVPSLRGADGVDGTTVSFLLADNRKLQKEEEEEERRREREEAEHEAHMQELDRRVQTDVPLTPAESRAWRKWAGYVPMPTRRKKKRKKKLPRSGCTRRRRRQWHDPCAGFAVCAVPRDVFPGRRLARDVRHRGRYGPEGQCCSFRFRQWHVQGSFCLYFTPRCVPLVVVRPMMMLRITAGMNQKDSHVARFWPTCWSSSIQDQFEGA